MLTMFVRALVLYVLVILLMRLMGKRQIGQLQPFELVFTVIIADLAATPMSDVGIPLLYGVLPIYNVNAAIIGGIMPLLSGLAMTTAVRDTMYGDLISGMTRALEAMLLATAVAIGVYTGLKMAAMMGGIAL